MKKTKISALMASLLMVSGVAYADAEFSFEDSTTTITRTYDVSFDADIMGTVDDVDFEVDPGSRTDFEVEVEDLSGTAIVAATYNGFFEIQRKTNEIDFEGDVVNAAVNTANIDGSINFTGAAVGTNTIFIESFADQLSTTVVSTSSTAGADNSTTNSTLANTSSALADSEDLAQLKTTLSTDVIGAINQADTTIANDDHGYSGWGRWGSWRDNHGDLEIVNVAYNNGDLLASVNIFAGGLNETVTTVPGVDGDVGAEVATLVPSTVMGLTVSTSAIGAANISTINVSR